MQNVLHLTKCHWLLSKTFEDESVSKRYHAYMNDWTLILEENLSTRPEPENEIDKTVFYFLRACYEHC